MENVLIDIVSVPIEENPLLAQGKIKSERPMGDFGDYLTVEKLGFSDHGFPTDDEDQSGIRLANSYQLV